MALVCRSRNLYTKPFACGQALKISIKFLEIIIFRVSSEKFANYMYRNKKRLKQKKNIMQTWPFEILNTISLITICATQKNDVIFSINGWVSFIRNCMVISSSQLCSYAFRRWVRLWSAKMRFSYYVRD